MGKKLNFAIPLLLHPHFVPKPPIYLEFPLRIAKGTVDHLTNGLRRTGSFHLLQLFMDQYLLFIG